MKILSSNHRPQTPPDHHHQVVVVDQQRKALVDQLRRINIYLLSLFIFLIIFNLFSFTVYSQQTQKEINKEQTVTNVQQQQTNQDIISYLFSNSVTSMILSTFIIAIVGTLIAKLRNFKKKLDMIEILTKSQVKMKQQAEQREKNFEKKFIDTQTAFTEQIKGLCDKIDVNTNSINSKISKLDEKIEDVEKNATAALIKYLSDNSFDRKR
jgi:preprotein translocase subunit SecY